MRPKSHGLGNAWVARWSGQWSHYGLIRGQSVENGLDNGRTTVWSECKVWKMVWTMVARRSDQRAKSGNWSGQWSHYGLIRVQSLENGLDNSRTTVWSEGKVLEVVWTMVALRSDQKAKSHYSLIIGRTKVWTMVALRSDQRPKSGHKLPQNLTIFIWLQFYYNCFWWLKIKISCTSKCLFVYIFY